jgi:aspartate oxidase
MNITTTEYLPLPEDIVPSVEGVAGGVGGICIVGAGLAGLATALNLKCALPNYNVMVVERESPQSNTQIAGQRYRAGIAGVRQDGRAEIEQLLASRNNGELTDAMTQFAEYAVRELQYWQQQPGFVECHDEESWFGPQWGVPNRAGKGRGMSVLNWFRHAAEANGVTFVKGDVRQISRDGEYVNGLAVHTREADMRLVAGQYVLAGGNMGGRLFIATNKDIPHSAQELAFEAGLPLVDSTIHMIHPFGNCDETGQPRLGCFETDELAKASVYLDGLSESPIFDSATTSLLHEHQAHYHFPEIVERLRRYGSIVLLTFPDGSERYARVSYHYSHLAVQTSDGVTVQNMRNLYVVGDTAGLGYWTAHHERFPGFALLKCLVDARLVARKLAEATFSETNIQLYPETMISLDSARVDIRMLQTVNSQYVLEWIAAPSIAEKKHVAKEWIAALNNQAGTYEDTDCATAFAVSQEMARAHEAMSTDTVTEPFSLMTQQAR